MATTPPPTKLGLGDAAQRAVARLFRLGFRLRGGAHAFKVALARRFGFATQAELEAALDRIDLLEGRLERLRRELADDA